MELGVQGRIDTSGIGRGCQKLSPEFSLHILHATSIQVDKNLSVKRYVHIFRLSIVAYFIFSRYKSSSNIINSR